jgi:YVTN family beta-propeller protein
VPPRVAVTPNGKTAFVNNAGSGTVSTIDIKTKTKHPTDIAVGAGGAGVAVTPDGKTAYVVDGTSSTVSTFDVKTRKENLNDITVGLTPVEVAVTPCRR